jgi:hypothetical protein
MLTAAELAFGASALWTAAVVFSRLALNMPHYEPIDPVAWSLWVCWLVTAALFLWWGVA